MKKYEAVLVDLFDTVVEFNFKRLPDVEYQGERARTTSRDVYDVFLRYYPGIGFEGFYPYFIDSYRAIQTLKHEEYREYPTSKRFEIMLGEMGLDSGVDDRELIDEMVLAHMSGLARCVELPDDNNSALDAMVSSGVRVGLVSNFDHSPTARKLLGDFGLTEKFETIVISEDVGWRKPNANIFNRALDNMNIDAQDTVFVGDNFNADVVGSMNLGMDAIWLNRNNESLESLDPVPAYIVNKFPEIVDIVIL